MESLEVGWGEVAEGGVPPAGVILALDELEDRGAGDGAGGPGLAVDPFFLEGRVERLARRRCQSRRRRCPFETSIPAFWQRFPNSTAVYWQPWSEMVHQPAVGATSVKRHLER